MWLKNLIFSAVCLLFASFVFAFVVPQPLDSAGDVSLNETHHDIEDTVSAVNKEFEESWQKAGLTPAALADDYSVARRIALSLTGSIPSIEDLRTMDSLPADTRLSWYTRRLLADRRHADYFAERLGRAYVGTDQGPFLIYRRRRFVSWLSDQILTNVPYDQLVKELVTADGLWTDSPAVNFLTANADEELNNRPDPIRMAGRTTRAFLGVRLDCMQCHDDNLEGQWLQSNFHELAAFYSDPEPSLAGIRDKSRDYNIKYLDEDVETKVTPAFPFFDSIAGATPKAGQSRREHLAAWIVHPDNKAFARTIVNRVWALAFGKPLVTPIDDIPLEGPYPPGLDRLADDFVEHGSDLRRLWSIIMQTKPFRLDSRMEAEVLPEHETKWAVFPLSRLRPEQVAGAIVQSGKLTTIDAESHVLMRFIRNQQVGDFVERYGDMGEDEFENAGETIPQRLVMLNGNLVRESTDNESPFTAAFRISKLATNDPAAIRAAYHAVLTRQPTAAEMEHFTGRLENRKHSRETFFEDLYWTLLNSTEFSWNH